MDECSNQSCLRSQDVLSFFEGRAKRNTVPYEINKVLYQDHAPELAVRRHKEELDLIRRVWRLNENDHVLDVGCGIGRLGLEICSHINSYVGIDFSPGLAVQAEKNLSNFKNVRIYCLDANAFTLEDMYRDEPFDKAIVSGVLIYMNDEHVMSCLSSIAQCMAEESSIYIREPMARKRRLVLNNHWSEELQARYSAIYRTPSELKAIFTSTLEKGGFCLNCEGEAFSAELQNRAETVPRYCVFERC